MNSKRIWKVSHKKEKKKGTRLRIKHIPSKSYEENRKIKWLSEIVESEKEIEIWQFVEETDEDEEDERPPTMAYINIYRFCREAKWKREWSTLSNLTSVHLHRQ